MHHRQAAARGQPVEERRARRERRTSRPPIATTPVTRARAPARARGTRATRSGSPARARVAGEEDRRQVGAGERPRARRSATEVGFSHERSRVAGGVADRHAAGGDRRRARRRGRTGSAPRTSANSAPSTRASRIVAAWPRRANAAPRKMIPIAARNSGIVERREDRAERDRERRPDDHQHEDQPDVVGLPHRAHRALDHPAHAAAALARRRRSGPRSRRRSRRCRAPRRRSMPSMTSAEAELGSISATPRDGLDLGLRRLARRAGAAARRPRAPSAT